eukprot:131557-Chlamydomonas_euryale.AAC.1
MKGAGLGIATRLETFSAGGPVWWGQVWERALLYSSGAGEEYTATWRSPFLVCAAMTKSRRSRVCGLV